MASVLDDVDELLGLLGKDIRAASPKPESLAVVPSEEKDGELPPFAKPPPKLGTKVIWQYWDQEADPSKIPPAARICKATVDAFHNVNNGWQYYFVSRFNLWHYLEEGVDLPFGFNSLEWEKVAQKADMIRVALLRKYGGVYVDITIVLMETFDHIWDDLYSLGNKLEYIGFRNKVLTTGKLSVAKGFEYSVWLMFSKPHSKLIDAWHRQQVRTLKRLLDASPRKNYVKFIHPMYLDFGDECLEKVVPYVEKTYPETLKVYFANGCWQNEQDMGPYDWKLYNSIVDDLMDHDTPIRHAHFFRKRESKYPLFIKLHRGNAQRGDYNDWLNKPGPWLRMLKQPGPVVGGKNIFQYWDQNADYTEIPPAARVCMATVKQLHPEHNGWRHFYVSRFNVWEYLEEGVDLPMNFNDLEWEKVAQKADMIRVALVRKYGGVYVDMTIVVMQAFDNIWHELEQKASQLEYIGWRNKVLTTGFLSVAKGFEYSVWFFMAKPMAKLIDAWHQQQKATLKRLLEKSPRKNYVKYIHPMYLDFGDECLEAVVPRMEKEHPKTFRIRFANGCWQNEEDMGPYDWQLYNGIIDDLMDKSTKIRHAHYWRHPDEKLPMFVKLHRGNAQEGNFQDWLKKPGHWLRALKQHLPTAGGKNMFFYWDQEPEPHVLPASGRACMATVMKLHPETNGWKHFYVNRFNLWEFLEEGVDLPMGFNSLQWENIAQKAHMIRVALLEKFGGVYIDTTVMTLAAIDPLWAQLQENDDLDFIGFKSKAQQNKKGKDWRYEIWLMFSKPQGKVIRAARAEQKQALERLLWGDEMRNDHVKSDHSEYLDFGDKVLEVVLPRCHQENPKNLQILPVCGDYQTPEEMGDKDAKIYKQICEDLMHKDKPVREVHFYREPKHELPMFVKLHRSHDRTDTLAQWTGKPGPWLGALKK